MAGTVFRTVRLPAHRVLRPVPPETRLVWARGTANTRRSELAGGTAPQELEDLAIDMAAAGGA